MILKTQNATRVKKMTFILCFKSDFNFRMGFEKKRKKEFIFNDVCENPTQKSLVIHVCYQSRYQLGHTGDTPDIPL